MQSTQTNSRRPKACQKLTGGKVPPSRNRRPRFASPVAPTLKGWQSLVTDTNVAKLQGHLSIAPASWSAPSPLALFITGTTAKNVQHSTFTPQRSINAPSTLDVECSALNVPAPTPNPNGVQTISPGLERSDYPGSTPSNEINPERVESFAAVIKNEANPAQSGLIRLNPAKRTFLKRKGAKVQRYMGESPIASSHLCAVALNDRIGQANPGKSNQIQPNPGKKTLQEGIPPFQLQRSGISFHPDAAPPELNNRRFSQLQLHRSSGALRLCASALKPTSKFSRRECGSGVT